MIRPDERHTLLHRLVREHLATFVAYTEVTYAAPLPGYVKDAFERYLACGVLSLPFELRGLAATKPDILTALGGIFAEEVERVTKRLAGVAGAARGSISFPQRFGGSLHLHVHFHLLAVDAVFDKHGEGVRIPEAPPAAKADVVDVAQRVHDRALAWLRRHRYLDERPTSVPLQGVQPAGGGGAGLSVS